jgi:hypothetical protein
MKITKEHKKIHIFTDVNEHEKLESFVINFNYLFINAELLNKIKK